LGDKEPNSDGSPLARRGELLRKTARAWAALVMSVARFSISETLDDFLQLARGNAQFKR
jgi:hypothetical protein